MAGLAAFATVASAAVGAVGTILSGRAASDAAEVEAQQRRQQAGEARAASQREAIQRAREARLLQSRQQAVAAASGGGAADPTVVRLMAQTGAQGRYNTASALYEGEARGRAFEYAGEMSRWQGRQQRTASYIDAGSTILRGLSAFGEMRGGFGFRRRPLDLSPYRF